MTTMNTVVVSENNTKRPTQKILSILLPNVLKDSKSTKESVSSNLPLRLDFL